VYRNEIECQFIYQSYKCKLVDCISDQAVRCTAHVHFCYGHVLEGLGLGTLALAWKVQASALRVELVAWP